MKRARIALALAFAIGAVAGPALADHDGHHRGRWGHRHDRGWHDRGWHGQGRQAYYSSEPDVYYAPPPVVYTPAYPSPGINFVFPLRIR